MKEYNPNIIQTEVTNGIRYEYIVVYDCLCGLNGYKPFMVARKLITETMINDYVEASNFKGKRYNSVIEAERDIKKYLDTDAINYKIKKGEYE